MHARRSAVFTTAALLTALGACGPTQAQSLSDMLSRGGACFARTYDEAHLRAHPDQTVTRFYLGDPGPDWREIQTPSSYNLAFGFQITSSADTYSGIAICEPSGDVAACGIEGDGGAFTIERNGDGLRIRLARMQVEGMEDFSPDLALADNRVMLLRPAHASACSPAEGG